MFFASIFMANFTGLKLGANLRDGGSGARQVRQDQLGRQDPQDRGRRLLQPGHPWRVVVQNRLPEGWRWKEPALPVKPEISL